MDGKQSLGERWTTYRPSKGSLVWSCAAGAIAATAVGFAWGGWVTGGAATKMAEAAAVSARSTLVAAICVDRFRASPDASAQLVTLKGLQSWDRGAFIEKGGWALMPDQPQPSKVEAKLCADQLAAL